MLRHYSKQFCQLQASIKGRILFLAYEGLFFVGFPFFLPLVSFRLFSSQKTQYFDLNAHQI